MRNLKRALSLTLASVMLLGMMVVGSSAAAGYDDVKETDNVEAIEVLQAVEVMVGDERGFGPDRPVSRAEMAVVMGKLLNLDYNYYASTCPFTDVSGNYDWARGWVGACAANGIVSGRGNGIYDPAATVTAVEAASMMMRALGYFQYAEDYAAGFQLATVKQGSEIGIFNGVGSDGNTPMTRNQVAQMALNALRSNMVTFTGTPGIEVNGVKVGYNAEYTPRIGTESKYNTITGLTTTILSDNGQYFIQLGEQLYDGKLKLDDAIDVFGRPSRDWEYDGKAIGTYIKEELMVMENVGKVTGNDLYTELGASTIDKYKVVTTVDGVSNGHKNAKDILKDAYFDDVDMNRNNKEKVGETGTGTLTQVFVDHEDDEVYVAVINTYLARAARDYDDKAEEATLTVYGIDEYRNDKEYVKTAKSSETMKVQDEDFTLVKDVKKDDPYLVTVADGEIQTMVPDEVLEGVTLTAFKRGDHVVSDGTEYAYTTTATYKDGDLDDYTGVAGNTNLKDITYNIYLDAYNNLIGIEEVDAVKNYVFLAGIDVDGSNLYSKTATANALFLDGTSKTIKINLSKSEFPAHPELGYTNVVISGNALLNTWCTYTVSGDMYTVKEVHATNADPQSGATGVNPANYPQNGDNDTKLAQSWQGEYKPNNKVSVKNMRLSGGTTGAFTNVYGDSTSVYLTPELDELYNDGSENTNTVNGVAHSYGVIKDVDTVTTGIADASIEIWSKERAQSEADGSLKQPIGNTAHGIYTLYDSDGIVIAAVIVGENEGVKDLVYVHSENLDLESYNSTDDIWTWTRRVIFNGEEITLTEKGDALSELKNMEWRQWYEIKRNNDGEIIKANPAYSNAALGSYREDAGTNENGYFVDLYSEINDRVETSTKDTVLYQTDGGPHNYANDPDCHTHFGLSEKLSVIGTNTLAVETLSGSGIHFRDNVNVVLQYWNQNTKQTEIETGTGVDDLKSMVDFVNDNNPYRGNDKYYLSALIEKGFATTIVIYDSYNNYRRPEADLGTYELTLGGVLNSIYTTSANRNSDVYIVNADRSITYVESNDDIATSTVNGYKRYTVPYGATIRIYDNDMGETGFMPFFSPIKAISGFYHYVPHYNAQRAYIEFRVDGRLDNDKMTIRERMITDGIYVGVESGAKADVTIDGVKYDANKNFIAYAGEWITAVTNAEDAKLYVNGVEVASPWSHQVVTSDLDFIIGTEGGTTPAPTYTANINVVGGTADKTTITAKAGDMVSFTVTPTTGYVFESVDPASVVRDGDNFTFTMPVGGVNVSVTYKAPSTGDGHWEWSDEAGGPIWVPGTAAASMAKFARAARAGGNGSPFDQYIGQYIRIKLNNIGLDKQYTVFVTTSTSGATTLKFGADLDTAGKKEIIQHMNDSGLGQLALQPEYVRAATAEEEAAWKGETPVVPDDIYVKADVQTIAGGTKATANLWVWLNGKESVKLTAEDIAKALTAAEYPTKAEDVDLTKYSSGNNFAAKSKTSGGADITIEFLSAQILLDKDTSNNLLYKVTYPGGEKFLKKADATALTGVEAEFIDTEAGSTEAAYLILKDVKAAKDANVAAAGETIAAAKSVVAVSKDAKGVWNTTTMIVTEDVEFVSAINLGGCITSSNSNLAATNGTSGKFVYDVRIETSDGHTDGAGSGSARYEFVQKGTKVLLDPVATTGDRDPLLVKDAKVILTINGVEDPRELIVETAGEAPATSFTIDGTDSLNKGMFSYSVKIEAPTTAYSVTVDGVPLTDVDLVKGTTDTYWIPKMTGYGLQRQNARGNWVALTTAVTALATPSATATDGADVDGFVKYQAVAGDAVGGKITLRRAYTVLATNAGTVWKAYENEDDATANTAVLYFPTTGGVIYVKDVMGTGNDTRIDLAWKDGSKTGIKAIKNTAYNDGFVAGKEGIWEVAVNKSITALTDLVAGVSIKATTKYTLADETKLELNKPAIDLMFDGTQDTDLVIDSNVKITEAVLTPVKGGDQTFKVDYGFDSVADQWYMDITLTSGTAINTSGAEVGNLTLTFSTGWVIVIPVVLGTIS